MLSMCHCPKVSSKFCAYFILTLQRQKEQQMQVILPEFSLVSAFLKNSPSYTGIIFRQLHKCVNTRGLIDHKMSENRALTFFLCLTFSQFQMPLFHWLLIWVVGVVIDLLRNESSILPRKKSLCVIVQFLYISVNPQSSLKHICESSGLLSYVDILPSYLHFPQLTTLLCQNVKSIFAKFCPLGRVPKLED